MAAEAERQAAAREQLLGERPQVGHEAVVPGHELVELAAAGDVLVLEAVRLARTHGAEGAQHDLLVDRRQLVAGPRKEARHGGEAVGDGAGARGTEAQGAIAAREPVVPACARSPTAHGPDLVAQVLLDEGNLGLRGEHDVAKPVSADPGWEPPP